MRKAIANTTNVAATAFQVHCSNLRNISPIWIAAEDVGSAGATLAVESGVLEVCEHRDGDRLYQNEG